MHICSFVIIRESNYIFDADSLKVKPTKTIEGKIKVANIKVKKYKHFLITFPSLTKLYETLNFLFSLIADKLVKGENTIIYIGANIRTIINAK